MDNGAFTLSTTFLQTLLHKEESSTLFANLPTYNENCERVTSTTRDREARWICAAGRRLGLSLSTVGSAVSIFDRVLSVVSVRFKYVNCVAMTALYLAVKLHEECFNSFIHQSSSPTSMPRHYFLYSEGESILDASTFLRRLNADYTVRELNRMEGQVLRVLDWDLLTLPSCTRFLEAMLAVIGAPHLIESMALRDNFEAVAASWALIGYYRSSTVALALVSLMLQSTLSEWPRVTNSLKEIFKINDLQFISCRSQMAQVLRVHHSLSLKEENEDIVRNAAAEPSTPKKPLMELNSGSNGCPAKRTNGGSCRKGGRRKRKSRRRAAAVSTRGFNQDDECSGVEKESDGTESAYGSMDSIAHYEKRDFADMMRYACRATDKGGKLEEMDEDVFEVLYKIVANVQQN